MACKALRCVAMLVPPSLYIASAHLHVWYPSTVFGLAVLAATYLLCMSIPKHEFSALGPAPAIVNNGADGAELRADYR